MARRLSSERQAELAELTRFSDALWSYLFDTGHLPSELRAAWQQGQAEAAFWPPGGALRGYRQAVQDALEMTREWPPAEVAVADQHLRGRGITTLSEMRARIWRQVPRILARGRIRTDEEYYLLIERLNDVDATALSAEERARASELVAAYKAER
jgi:hypothetical protein